MPSLLKVFVIASSNINNQCDNVCSALKDNGHHVNVLEAVSDDNLWESVEKYPIEEQNHDNLIHDRRLNKATIGVSWADILLLVGFGRDACFLAGVAHVSGVRAVVFDEFPFEWSNSLPAQSISFWCHTVKDVVNLANNWEDPVILALEE